MTSDTTFVTYLILQIRETHFVHGSSASSTDNAFCTNYAGKRYLQPRKSHRSDVFRISFFIFTIFAPLLRNSNAALSFMREIHK